MIDPTLVYSAVKNISGGEMTFAWLLPHGRTLASNETILSFGDIRDVGPIGLYPGDRGMIRNQQGMQRALEEGLAVIVYTPAPLLQDLVTGLTKVLTLSNGTLGTAVPNWDGS
jgi:hypothetical protein